MPDKNPETERWGGPGASHEDASQPQPPKPKLDDGDQPWAGESRSRVSGGGGELDAKHSHDPAHKSDKTPNS